MCSSDLGSTISSGTTTPNYQDYIFVSELISNGNWGVNFMDFTSSSATTIDLGLPRSGWWMEDIYPIQGFGHVFILQNNSTYDEWYIYVMDNTGNIIYNNHLTNAGNYDYYYLEGGNGFYFFDYTNGVVYYYNSYGGGTFTYDKLTYEIDIYWNNDNCTSNGSFILQLDALNERLFYSFLAFTFVH